MVRCRRSSSWLPQQPQMTDSLGLAQSLRWRDCARPLSRAQEVQLRTRTVSVQRQAVLAARAAETRGPFAAGAPVLVGSTNRKLGVSFRGQVPVAGYICDFVCASRRLPVEVDGAHHALRRAADVRRDAVVARPLPGCSDWMGSWCCGSLRLLSRERGTRRVIARALLTSKD